MSIWPLVTSWAQWAIAMTLAWFDHDTRPRQIFVVVAALSLLVLCVLQWLWFAARLRRQRRMLKETQDHARGREHELHAALSAFQSRLETTTTAARRHENAARELNSELATWRSDAQKIEQTRHDLADMQERLNALAQELQKERDECKREQDRTHEATEKAWTEAQLLLTKDAELQNRANELRAAEETMEQRGAELARDEEWLAAEHVRLNEVESQLRDEFVALQRKDERIAAREEALELRRSSIDEREAAVPALERRAAETARRSEEEARRIAQEREEVSRARWDLRMAQLRVEEARRDVDSHRAALASLAELYDAKREQVELWNRLISRQDGLHPNESLRTHE